MVFKLDQIIPGLPLLNEHLQQVLSSKPTNFPKTDIKLNNI